MLDCIVSIRFDLDLGPTVDNVVPEGALSAEDKLSLARIAFPDTAPDNGRSFIYFFTIPRKHNHTITTSQSGEQHDNSNNSTQYSIPNTYGVGYFRQKRDPACPRGYVQQALLLLTPYPYYTLLDKVMSVVAPVFGQCCLQSPDSATSTHGASRPFLVGAHFQQSSPSSCEDSGDQRAVVNECKLDTSGMTQEELLSAVWKDVLAWEAPAARRRQDLTLLGNTFKFTPPPRAHGAAAVADGVIQEGSKRVNEPPEKGTFPSLREWVPDVPPSLQNLPLVSSGLLTLENAGTWIKLWELSLAGEPIVVIGSDPTLSSAMVLAIESLLLPLRHPPQYNLVRPYVTIQDPETAKYGAIASGNANNGEAGRKGGVGVILGVTNPFFLKTLKGMGCVVSVLDENDGSGAADRINIMLKGSSHKRHQRADINWSSSDMPGISLGLSLTSRLHSTSEVSSSSCCINSTKSATSTKELDGSPYKFVISVSNQAAVLITRLRTMEAVSAKQQAVIAHQQQQQQQSGAPPSLQPVELQSGLAVCPLVRPPSIVDDTTRKFFESLTGEFLAPIKSWFDTVVSSHKPFALCCAKTALQELSPSEFMKRLAANRIAKKKPAIFNTRKYSEYEPLYRRFVYGPLFESWREGAIRGYVEVEVNRLAFVAATDDDRHDVTQATMYPDSPLLQVEASPLLSRRYTNDEMTDTFINLHNYAARELSDYCLDPDVRLVLDCCVVLKIIVGMCDGGSQCELFRDKIDRLHLQANER